MQNYIDKRIIFKKWKTKSDKIGWIYLLQCLYCKRVFELRGFRFNQGRGKYCSLVCANKVIGLHKGHKLTVGSKNGKWKGGCSKDLSGYMRILMSTHPNCDCYGYVKEHRLIVEKQIGRYLHRWEIVHHINGIKDDNRLENLMLFPNEKAHRTYHSKVKEKL